MVWRGILILKDGGPIPRARHPLHIHFAYKASISALPGACKDNEKA